VTIDLCAGAGGKALALAAQMKDGGPLIAFDTHAQRFEKIKACLKRAGVSNVTRKLIRSENDNALERYRGRADRVFVDAPCSGSGAWRRNPSAKWQLTPELLSSYVQKQADILSAAARLVAPGGRLIYATCSVLAVENERQMEKFFNKHTDFSVLPVAEIWPSAVGGTCPTQAPYLNLSPAVHGTDGFFVGIAKRAGAAGADQKP